MSLIFLVVLMGIMYFIMIRPQQKRMKEHAALLRDGRDGRVTKRPANPLSDVLHQNHEADLVQDLADRCLGQSTVSVGATGANRVGGAGRRRADGRGRGGGGGGARRVWWHEFASKGADAPSPTA